MTNHLTYEENMSLTVVGDSISFQVRGYPSSPTEDAFALHIHDGAYRSAEDGHPILLSMEEVHKLREVLNEAVERFG